MPRLDGRVDVRCSPERAWDLFTRFDDLARLIPSVEGVEIQGDRVLARVAVKLGALPITSRVVLEVTERKPMSCLKAIGISYLGETVVEQLAKKPLSEITADSAGRLELHLDLRPGETADSVAVVYEASVEAEGRLRRIYDSILKTKAPAMMREFAENIRTELEAEPPAAPATAPDARGEAPDEASNDAQAVATETAETAAAAGPPGSPATAPAETASTALEAPARVGFFRGLARALIAWWRRLMGADR